MGKKKNVRKRKSSGWAHTKVYPHASHPAAYRRTNLKTDDIEYITFTHSSEVDLGNKKVLTVPLLDNISPKERKQNKSQGKKFGENRSYAYPKVFVGKRSALHKETNEFNPVDYDKNLISIIFDVFPRENVPVTGGKGKHRKKKKSRNK